MLLCIKRTSKNILFLSGCSNRIEKTVANLCMSCFLVCRMPHVFRHFSFVVRWIPKKIMPWWTVFVPEMVVRKMVKRVFGVFSSISFCYLFPLFFFLLRVFLVLSWRYNGSFKASSFSGKRKMVTNSFASPRYWVWCEDAVWRSQSIALVHVRDIPSSGPLLWDQSCAHKEICRKMPHKSNWVREVPEMS